MATQDYSEYIRRAAIARFCESKFPTSLYNDPCSIDHFQISVENCKSVIEKMCEW